MKYKLIVLFCVLALALGMTGCSIGEETTLTGIVISVDGTVISLREMDTNMEGENFAKSEMPSMPADMEEFQPFGDFAGEEFAGDPPDGETFPQWDGSGETPEPPELPEDAAMPQMPENGDMQEIPSGGNGGMDSGFGNFAADAETKDIDIGDAHISVEIEGGKASGSLEDITPGAFVTITLNSKGEVTNVLVSSMSGFGGGRPSRGTA